MFILKRNPWFTIFLFRYTDLQRPLRKIFCLLMKSKSLLVCWVTTQLTTFTYKRSQIRPPPHQIIWRKPDTSPRPILNFHTLYPVCCVLSLREISFYSYIFTNFVQLFLSGFKTLDRKQATGKNEFNNMSTLYKSWTTTYVTVPHLYLLYMIFYMPHILSK